MKIDSVFGVKIAYLDSPEELDEAVSQKCDIAELPGEHQEFGYIRPMKVSWRAYLQDYSDIYDIIKSHKLRKNIKRWSNSLNINNFSSIVQKDLDESAFMHWFAVYSELMQNKERLTPHITQNWLDDKKQQNKKAWGVFLYFADRMIGGNVGTYGKEMLMVGYGAAEKMENLDWNLGALLDVETMHLAKDQGYPTVSFGKDTNLYGLYLTPGLFSYKSRMGLTPEPIDKNGYTTTKILSYEHLSDPVIFISKNAENLVTTVLTQKDNIIPKEFASRGIERVEVIKV